MNLYFGSATAAGLPARLARLEQNGRRGVRRGFRSPRAGLQRESAEFPGQRRQGRHTSRPAGTDAAPVCGMAVDSNLKDGIKLLQEAPIPTRKIFAGWEGDGPAGHLKLDIPLDHDEAGKTGGRDFPPWARPEDAQSEAGYERSEGATSGSTPAKGLSARRCRPWVGGQRGKRAGSSPRGAAILFTRLLLNGQVAMSLSDWLGAGQRPLLVSGRLPFPAQPAAGWEATASASIRICGRRRRPAGASSARRPPRRGPTQWRMTLMAPNGVAG